MPRNPKKAAKAVTKRTAKRAPGASQKTLEAFLKLLTALYPVDDWAPGIVVSYLPEGVWYGAVYQYPKGAQGQKNWNGENGGSPRWRTRLHCAKADTFDEMVSELVSPWTAIGYGMRKL